MSAICCYPAMLMVNKNMTTDGTPIKVQPAALQILSRTFI